jgi:outer membrane protein, multidrug efflux system
VRPRTAPAVPVGIPSEVLQRRPDVASAERAMAAANAQIGVARAAYYPSLTLSTAGGVDSRLLSTVFDAPSLLWSLGLAVTAPLYDAGRTDANVAIAQAGYQLAVANYRRTVLTALQEVQDGLNGSVALDRAVAQARLAERSAERVLQLANDRYEGGAASYLEVITAQQALLNGQRQVAQLLGQRMLVTVFLVKAVGGEW